MRISTLLIVALVSTCTYHIAAETMLEKGKDTVKETVQTGADMVKEKTEEVKDSVKQGADTVKEKAEAAKDSVKEGAESVKDSVKETVQEWNEKAHSLWSKSGAAFRDASQAVRDGIKYITPEFLRTAETDPASKLQEWKTKASSQALKELNDAATLLEEANTQVGDIMKVGGADAKAKMTRLRVGVDHAVRQSMRAFKSLRDQAGREGVPQTVADRLKAGWTATGNAVDSLKELITNAYNKEEDKHEIVQDLDATFKQWEKFKAAASEKLEAAKDSAKETAQNVKDAAAEKLQAAKDAVKEEL